MNKQSQTVCKEQSSSLKGFVKGQTTCHFQKTAFYKMLYRASDLDRFYEMT